LRILELREGATEGEVKAAYRAMSRIYHPDKHNSGFTGMSDELKLMRKQLNSFSI
jgi:DnaJ-class molecular chaperone